MPRYPKPWNSCTPSLSFLTEGQFDVMIYAPNQQVDLNLCYPLRSELPAIWSDISNASQGFKDHSTTRIVLDEGSRKELSSFGRPLKMRPDEHQLVQRLANNLWFRQTYYVRSERGDLNALSTKEDLKAMALRTKAHTNLWLYQSPRLCALDQDAFDDAPVVVREIHRFLKKILTRKNRQERRSCN